MGCLILLTSDEENMGQKLFRILKCWSNFPWYKEHVSEEYRFGVVSSWSGYVLSEKLKFIEGILKKFGAKIMLLTLNVGLEV